MSLLNKFYGSAEIPGQINIVNQCQERPANVSVRQWLADNGIKEKAYYYWLRKFRKEAYDQMQVPAVAQPAEISFAEASIPVATHPKSAPCTSFSGPVAIKEVTHQKAG